MRRERAAESILGNERLTADLDDAAAGALLEWGLDCSGSIVSDTAGMDDEQAEEVLAPRMKATRRMMRNVSRLLGADTPDESKTKDRLGKIAAQAQIVYGREIEAPDAEGWRRVVGAGDVEARIWALRAEVESGERPAGAGERVESREKEIEIETRVESRETRVESEERRQEPGLRE